MTRRRAWDLTEISNVKRGARIELGSGLHCFRSLSFDATAKASPYRVRMRLVLDGAYNYVIDTFTVSGSADEPVTAERLRQIPIEWIRRVAVIQLGLDSDEPLPLDVAQWKTDPPGPEVRALGLDSLYALQIVALAYLWGQLTGSPPAVAVAQRLECSAASAARWIAAAKDAALIPEKGS